SQVIAPLRYSFPVDSLIPAFKHQHRLTWGRLLARLLQQAVIHHYRDRQLQLPDAVIPLPLHRSRQARRGFNQAMELARPIAGAPPLPSRVWMPAPDGTTCATLSSAVTRRVSPVVTWPWSMT